jgi:purine-binding chemotaxis protein CheW
MEAIKIVTLGLADEIFAVEAEMVQEILDPVPITQVPNADPFVSGLINVRGKVMPLADPHVRFGMPTPPPTVDTRIVVVEVEVNGETINVGLLADKVYEVAEVTRQSMVDPPKLGMRWKPEFLQGIGKRGEEFMAIVNLAGLLGFVDSSADLGAADGRVSR